MNSNDKSFKYNGIKYFVEEKDHFYFLYTWYEGQKVSSKPIPKDRIEILDKFYKSELGSSFSMAITNYVSLLFKRSFEEIESGINQMKVNQLIYQTAIKRKQWEQDEHDKIWKKSVSK